MHTLSHNLLQAVVSESREGITISDNTKPGNPLVWVNEAFEMLTGYASHEIIGKNCRFLQASDTKQPAIAKIRTAFLSEQSCLVTLRNYRKNGTMFWNEVSLSPIHGPDGQVTHYLGIQKDVTAQIAQRESVQENLLKLQSSNEILEELIHVDPLSGLHNRRYLENQLATQWTIASRQNISMTAFMIDIDYFKSFNDVYGHLKGDEAIKSVSEVLSSCFLRSADFVSRYGGEEFFILTMGMGEMDASEYSRMLVRNIEALKIPHSRSPMGTLTISVGYTQVVPHRGMHANELIHQADQALYKAKALGKNISARYSKFDEC